MEFRAATYWLMGLDARAFADAAHSAVTWESKQEAGDRGISGRSVVPGLEVVAEAELHAARRVLHGAVGAEVSAGKA